MDVWAETSCLRRAVMVATTSVGVPGRRLKAMPVVLSDVHLSATACAAPSRVTIGVPIVRKSEIEIVVHIAMSSSQVHVKLDETTSKIVGSFGTNTATSMNSPAIGVQLRAPVINVEICATWTICRMPTWTWGWTWTRRW
jgi:hypothetical protein